MYSSTTLLYRSDGDMDVKAVDARDIGAVCK